jgi:hypothetical protein
MEQILVCTPRRLPVELLVRAARTAVEINPLNHPPLYRLTRVLPEFKPTPERIAVVTTKYWGLKECGSLLDSWTTRLRTCGREFSGI